MIRGHVKRMLYRLACMLGVHHVARRLNRNKLVILAYHAIAATDDDSALVVTHAAFERQVAYLRRHYDIVPIDGAIEALYNGALRQPTACITFDDGYRNNLTSALPVLSRAGVPATIFLSTGFIGTDRPLWTTAVATLLQNARIPGAHARQTIENLKRTPARQRRMAVASITTGLAAEYPGSSKTFEWLDWPDIEELGNEELITFGAHTVNHEIVSRLEDDELTTEINDSVTTVRAHAKRTAAVFAYPNGRAEDFDARAQTLVRGSGLAGAVSTIDGLNDRNTDPYALRRIVVGSDMDFAEFRLATSGVLASIRKALRA